MKFADHYCRNLSESFFPIDEAYDLGRNLFHTIETFLDGWFVTSPHDAGILAQLIRNTGHGDHLEIGTAWGGSAILAALVKRYYSLSGKVVCVDPIAGRDTVLDRERSEESITENFKRFYIDPELIIEPFSLSSVEGRRFASVLIDGDHREEVARENWLDVKQIVDKYVMVHDYDKVHQGIVTAIDDKSGFSIVHISGGSIVMRKE
jgi:cephalosporin hydroxylase